MILSKESSSWKVQNSLNFLDRNGGDWHNNSLWSQLTTPRPCNIRLDSGGTIDIKEEEGFGATVQVDIDTGLTKQIGSTLEILELPLRFMFIVIFHSITESTYAT